MITALTAEFFDDYKNVFIESLLQSVVDSPLQDVITEFDLLMLKINVELTNLNISHASLDVEDSMIDIRDESPHVLIKLVNAGFHFTFDYHIWSEPELIEDRGKATSFLEQLNVTISFSPTAWNGQLQVEIGDASVAVADFGLNLEGGDVASIVSFFYDDLEYFIKNFLIGQLSQ